MNIKIPKILFIDHSLIDQLPPILPEYNTIIPYHLTDLYLYQYLEKLQNVKVVTTCPQKDTIEYMMVQCQKTEWVRQAIILDKYHSDQYMWIDFGIYQFIDKLPLTAEQKYEKFSQYLYQIEYQKTNCVRIPHIWNLRLTIDHFDDYLRHHVCWYFAGSLFGGGKNALIQFADTMKEVTLTMVNKESWLVWEVNLWYLVYQRHPTCFEPYLANHDETIFANYKKT